MVRSYFQRFWWLPTPLIKLVRARALLGAQRARLRTSRMCTPEALLEAVRGLRVAEPDLGFKPLLAKLREQQPDLHPVTFCCDFVSGSRNCVRSPSAGRHLRL